MQLISQNSFHFCKKNTIVKHRGEIIEKAVRESGISITELARRLNKSRRHIYNIFNNSGVDIDTIIQIGKIIHKDFSNEIQYINTSKKYFEPTIASLSVKEEQSQYESIALWREKYFTLLEEYNKLLEKYVQKVEKDSKK